MEKIKTEEAYSEALTFAKNHYENFPVVSLFVPKELRKHVAVIYRFARTADDYADEGNLSSEERLKRLDAFEFRLTELLKGNYGTPFEAALSNTIKEKGLSSKHFYDLLSAFKQDVNKKTYTEFEELLDYCERSANPVGRLILELFEVNDIEAKKYSDKICTALQLTNFWQDVSVDYEKGRIYIPQEDMKKFAVDEKVLERKENIVNFKELLKFEVERTQNLFDEGKKLLSFLKRRLKLEIKLTILGGEAILNKIVKQNYEILGKKPKLAKKDFAELFLKSFY